MLAILLRLMWGPLSWKLCKVECYSGYKYPQEPRAFYLEAQRCEVEAVEGQGLTPEGPIFKVKASGKRYILFYWEHYDEWFVQEG